MTLPITFENLFTYDGLEDLFKGQIADTRTVGRDGIRMQKFRTMLTSELTLISSNVLSSKYRFTGYKQKLISKGAKKPPREISIPTIRDRVTQRALCNYLHSCFSDRLQPPPHFYIKSISKLATNLDSEFCFLRIDIKDFYPSIKHDILLDILKNRITDVRILNLVESSITCPTGVANTKETKNIQGIPQGLSISNILSSIYITKIDELFGGGNNYYRFVDDILFVVQKSEAKELFNNVSTELGELGLIAHPLGDEKSSKSNIALIENGVEYLGYRISTEGTSIRDSSYKKMLVNLSRLFTDYKYSTDKKKFLWRLNLKVAGCVMNSKRYGWVSFFSQSTNMSQFARMDAFVSENLMKYNVELNDGKVKRFVKAYHEHRYNFKKSKYILKFENYSIQDMIRTICTLSDREYNDVASWDEPDIKNQFWKMVKKETENLEKDLFEAFS